MRVRWLRGALSNLHQAVEYIAQDNPKAAASVAMRIKEAVDSLMRFPNLGRPGRLKGTRELRVTALPYIIRYRVTKQHIEILRIHHTSQLWPE